RSAYSRHVIISCLVAATIAGLVLAYPSISRMFNKEELQPVSELKTIKYTELAAPPPIDQNTPPPPKLDVPPPVKTIIKFLPPKVTEKEIPEEEEIPTIEE